MEVYCVYALKMNGMIYCMLFERKCDFEQCGCASFENEPKRKSRYRLPKGD